MLLLSFLLGLAFAQSEPTIENGVQKVNFGELNVEGRLNGPQIKVTNTKGDPDWNPLVQVRTDFIPEMFSSCEEL